MSDEPSESAHSELGARDNDSPGSAATAATPAAGKLLKRSEAARLLGVSAATIRRMEGTTLAPVLGPDGVHRFREEHVRELVIHRVRMVPESPDAYDAEEAATALDLFDQDVHPVDVVKRTKLHPRAVAAMHREWVSPRGVTVSLGFLVEVVGEAGFERAQVAEITEIVGGSRTEDGTRVDVSARELVAMGPSETGAAATAPTTSEDALKLAIKLAVDAGEYERADALIEVAKGRQAASSLVELASAREHCRHEGGLRALQSCCRPTCDARLAAGPLRFPAFQLGAYRCE